MHQDIQAYGKSPQIAYSRELLAERINPQKYGYSPLMTAIVGLFIGHDYKIRDSRGGRLTSLAYTSDGYVIASTTSHDTGIFIGGISDLENNLSKLVADARLSPDEFELFSMLTESGMDGWDWDSEWNWRLR